MIAAPISGWQSITPTDLFDNSAATARRELGELRTTFLFVFVVISLRCQNCGASDSLSGEVPFHPNTPHILKINSQIKSTGHVVLARWIDLPV